MSSNWCTDNYINSYDFSFFFLWYVFSFPLFSILAPILAPIKELTGKIWVVPSHPWSLRRILIWQHRVRLALSVMRNRSVSMSVSMEKTEGMFSEKHVHTLTYVPITHLLLWCKLLRSKVHCSLYHCDWYIRVGYNQELIFHNFYDKIHFLWDWFISILIS